MKTLMTINIKITTPYLLANHDEIVNDHRERLTKVIKMVIKDELVMHHITGLNVEIKVK